MLQLGRLVLPSLTSLSKRVPSLRVLSMIPFISTIPVVQLASGDRLSLQVYQFQGAIPGKKAYLQSNLHGAEISGNAVIHQLIEF